MAYYSTVEQLTDLIKILFRMIKSQSMERKPTARIVIRVLSSLIPLPTRNFDIVSWLNALE